MPSGTQHICENVSRTRSCRTSHVDTVVLPIPPIPQNPCCNETLASKESTLLSSCFISVVTRTCGGSVGTPAGRAHRADDTLPEVLPLPAPASEPCTAVPPTDFGHEDCRRRSSSPSNAMTSPEERASARSREQQAAVPRGRFAGRLHRCLFLRMGWSDGGGATHQRPRADSRWVRRSFLNINDTDLSSRPRRTRFPRPPVHRCRRCCRRRCRHRRRRCCCC